MSNIPPRVVGAGFPAQTPPRRTVAVLNEEQPLHRPPVVKRSCFSVTKIDFTATNEVIVEGGGNAFYVGPLFDPSLGVAAPPYAFTVIADDNFSGIGFTPNTIKTFKGSCRNFPFTKLRVTVPNGAGGRLFLTTWNEDPEYPLSIESST